jgi:indole-3-acetate monooxygenase
MSLAKGATAETTASISRLAGQRALALRQRRQHADWIAGFAVMTQAGKPLPGPAGEGGPPLVRGFALPASDWQIEDTWHVAGLKGTGSDHVSLRDKLVPAANFFDVATGVSHLPGPLYQTVAEYLPLIHSAMTTAWPRVPCMT